MSVETCTNCGVDVDKEPTVLCDECEGNSEAADLRAQLAARDERVEEFKREVERRDELLAGADADLAARDAEIERLKAFFAKFDNHRDWHANKLADERDEARAEVVRLREALEAIAECSTDEMGKTTARNALAETEDEKP